ncbi:hypothetical protein [Neisseria sp. Ec49-e6-T10]|uniref:hypothetical protein n=1 Tax=Neisseria sp. Ec49-e6-T10 TaxID=3140744 RepID=UPI003EBC0EC7
MADIKTSLDQIMNLDGVLCCSIVDSNTGMMLGSAGSGVDLEIASAGNTEVVRAKLKTMDMLGLDDHIEDILISLGKQFHIIRPIASAPGIFIYVVLDNTKSNLALARRKTQEVEKSLQF